MVDIKCVRICRCLTALSGFNAVLTSGTGQGQLLDQVYTCQWYHQSGNPARQYLNFHINRRPTRGHVSRKHQFLASAPRTASISPYLARPTELARSDVDATARGFVSVQGPGGMAKRDKGTRYVPCCRSSQGSEDPARGGSRGRVGSQCTVSYCGNKAMYCRLS